MISRGAGGTSGGIGEFFLGLGLMGLGVYLFLSHVMVTTNIGSMWYGHGGLIILPFGLGLALVFFSAKSVLGWVLTVGSIAAVLVSVLANLTLFFAPAGLLRTVGMIALMFIGFLMMVRSLRAK